MKFQILAFLIGLGAAIQVNFVAAASISELLCILIIIFNPKILLTHDKTLKKLLIFGLLWIVGILFSDLINDRPLADTQRAIGAVVLLLSSTLVAFELLSRQPYLFLTYGLGLGISYALQYYLFPSSVMQSLLERGFPLEQLKEIYFAIAFFPLCMSAGGFAWFMNYRFTSLVILAGYGALALSYDRRSIFLVALITIFYLATMLKEKSAQAPESNRIRNIKIISKIFAISVGFFMATQIYEYTASNGLLGEGALNKYEIQSNNKGLGLASGRIDFFMGLYGAIERPIFGYGSYAADTTGIRQRFLQFMSLPPSGSSNSGLPGHSHIVGAWLYAGGLSLPFWIYVIKLLTTFHLRATLFDKKIIGYSFGVVLYALWNVMFSPFSNRIELSFVFAFVILNLNYYNLKRRSEAIHTRMIDRAIGRKGKFNY